MDLVGFGFSFLARIPAAAYPQTARESYATKKTHYLCRHSLASAKVEGGLNFGPIGSLFLAETVSEKSDPGADI